MLKELSLKDKKIFERFLSLKKHYLSSYQFSNIFSWKALYEINWTLIEDNLCVFFKDSLGCFMYLAPLGKKIVSSVIKSCFKIMDNLNKNYAISRIENVEESEIVFFKNMGYKIKNKYPEYIYLKEDLVKLKGNRFKAKRANINYFIKNYKFKVLPFSLRYKEYCIQLYNYWMKERKNRYNNSIYLTLLQDSFRVFNFLVNYYNLLEFQGWIVKVNDEVKGFTVGYPLNEEMFCIFYEIADLKIKGLSQFIFWFFCQSLPDRYKFINVMDDSGLDNLRRTKLSYLPLKLVSAYIVSRDG